MSYKIPLIKPYITDQLKQRVIDVLDSGYLTEGPVTREFENQIASFCSAKHCLAVTSCTTGLELALRALGIGPGDEVIVPGYTYPATAQVVNIVGATAVIVDINPQNMLIDYDTLETAITPKTKAIIPVSLFGNPLNWDRLNKIKSKHSLYIIEDAACALGSSYKNKKTGTLADITVFSHHPRKFITTGEGGTIVTDNSKWADWMASYKHFGIASKTNRLDTQFEHIGTNYKLSNILAAVGLEQLRHINELLAERRRLAERYQALLADTPDISLTQTTYNGTHSWQTFCVFVNNRDKVMSDMRQVGIEAQIGTYALHTHPAFAHNPLVRIHGKMTGCQYAFDHTLALPLFQGMTENEQYNVVNALKRMT